MPRRPRGQVVLRRRPWRLWWLVAASSLSFSLCWRRFLRAASCPHPRPDRPGSRGVAVQSLERSEAPAVLAPPTGGLDAGLQALLSAMVVFQVPSRLVLIHLRFSASTVPFMSGLSPRPRAPLDVRQHAGGRLVHDEGVLGVGVEQPTVEAVLALAVRLALHLCQVLVSPGTADAQATQVLLEPVQPAGGVMGGAPVRVVTSDLFGPLHVQFELQAPQLGVPKLLEAVPPCHFLHA
eukprot:scaffold259_cov252-Pinguiococcus_pyrenoidosus.AAC.25